MPKFRFLTKIFIFDQNFDFWPKFRFLTKISIFDQKFDFWPKVRFLTTISIFDQNFEFYWILGVLGSKLWFFSKHFDVYWKWIFPESCRCKYAPGPPFLSTIRLPHAWIQFLVSATSYLPLGSYSTFGILGVNMFYYLHTNITFNQIFDKRHFSLSQKSMLTAIIFMIFLLDI